MPLLTRLGLPTSIVALFAFQIVAKGQGLDDEQVDRGRSLYDAQCARCHGKALEGQADWRTPLPNGRLPAPPHDASGHSWHHPDKILVGITKHGLKPYVGEDYESDMPAFASTLSDAQIAAVIAYIKSTWPERERQYQERLNRKASEE